VLDDAGEQALCLYIDLADEIGLAIRGKTLLVAANAILRNHHSEDGPPRTVSKMWASRWLSRHPQYKKHSLKPLAAKRKNTHDPEGIRGWFRKLLAVRSKYRIVDTDIYNMDETRFSIGVGRRHKVITRAGNLYSRRQTISDPNNRDYITSIEAISTAGVAIAPILILKNSELQERWIVDTLDDSTALACSKTGYSNDDINVE
jgi:Tc5 transposase DNA-binding domain